VEAPSSQIDHRALPYRQRDDFLSPAEFSFYHALKLSVGDRAAICPKVNLADIVFVVDRDKNFPFVGRINQKHIDFVVCDPRTMRPLLGIELDDRSHERGVRQERDAFVDEVFRTAGLPLSRIPTKNAYQVSELSWLIEQYITHAATGVVAQELGSTMPDTECANPVSPICPKCNVPLVMRTATRGKGKGQQFWGCPNFPRCRVTTFLSRDTK
jgi:hypothetical protein